MYVVTVWSGLMIPRERKFQIWIPSKTQPLQARNNSILLNTFDDSLPLQMPISTQRKLRLLVLLQNKCLYTCKNIVKKPNLEEFLHKIKSMS